MHIYFYFIKYYFIAFIIFVHAFVFPNSSPFYSFRLHCIIESEFYNSFMPKTPTHLLLRCIPCEQVPVLPCLRLWLFISACVCVRECLCVCMCICICVIVSCWCLSLPASASTHNNPGFQENINDISQNVAAHKRKRLRQIQAPKAARVAGGSRAAEQPKRNPLGCTKAEPQ